MDRWEAEWEADSCCSSRTLDAADAEEPALESEEVQAEVGATNAQVVGRTSH